MRNKTPGDPAEAASAGDMELMDDDGPVGQEPNPTPTHHPFNQHKERSNSQTRPQQPEPNKPIPWCLPAVAAGSELGLTWFFKFRKLQTQHLDVYDEAALSRVNHN